MKFNADDYAELLDDICDVYNKITHHPCSGCFREDVGNYLLKRFNIKSEDAIKAWNKIRTPLKSATTVDKDGKVLEEVHYNTDINSPDFGKGKRIISGGVRVEGE